MLLVLKYSVWKIDMEIFGAALLDEYVLAVLKKLN